MAEKWIFCIYDLSCLNLQVMPNFFGVPDPMLRPKPKTEAKTLWAFEKSKCFTCFSKTGQADKLSSFFWLTQTNCLHTSSFFWQKIPSGRKKIIIKTKTKNFTNKPSTASSTTPKSLIQIKRNSLR